MGDRPAIGYNTGMPNAFEQILYEVDDPVATITLNRPEQLNAWTARMGHEVAAAIGQAERDPAVVGIILTGAGRGFCAGADLGMLASVTATDGDADSRESAAAQIVEASVDVPGDPDAGADLRGTYTYLMSVAKPVIAAINGPVAGMGVPVVLACDLRLMSTHRRSHDVLRPAWADRRVGHRLAAVPPRRSGARPRSAVLGPQGRRRGGRADRAGQPRPGAG